MNDEIDYIREKYDGCIERVELLNEQSIKLIRKVKKNDFKSLEDYLSVQLRRSQNYGTLLAYSDILLRNLEKGSPEHKLVLEGKQGIQRILRVMERGLSKIIGDELKK